MQDTPDPLRLLRAAAAAREAAGLRRVLHARSPGRRAGCDLASNDYLGLAANPTAAAAQQTCARLGVPAGCFGPPSGPAGRACLRLAARATLTEPDFTAVRRALAALARQTRTQAPAGQQAQVPTPAGRRSP